MIELCQEVGFSDNNDYSMQLIRADRIGPPVSFKQASLILKKGE